MYIRQAVRVRGQSELRRLGDERRRGELLSNSGRQSSLYHYAMPKCNRPDKSHVDAHVLTVDAFFC